LSGRPLVRGAGESEKEAQVRPYRRRKEMIIVRSWPWQGKTRQGVVGASAQQKLPFHHHRFKPPSFITRELQTSGPCHPSSARTFCRSKDPCQFRPYNVSLPGGIQSTKSTHEEYTSSIRAPNPGFGASRHACLGPGSSGPGSSRQQNLQAAPRMEEGLKDSAGRLEQRR
jgi:hypothetical protein